MWYVYLVKSIKRKWYYAGSTNRLKARLEEHNKGRVRSTKNFLPLHLVFTKEFNTEVEAGNYERKLKSCRIEKEKIIRQIENKE